MRDDIRELVQLGMTLTQGLFDRFPGRDFLGNRAVAVENGNLGRKGEVGLVHRLV